MRPVPPWGGRSGVSNSPFGSALIWGFIAISALIEALLWGSDLGLWGGPRLRQTAYEWWGFWPGLLAGWRPNYSAQPGLMFVSYALLHGGPGHLATNMMTLYFLGYAVIARAGARGFLWLYIGAALGGAVFYALLASSPQPMVGASGALFGLAGALLAWAYIDRHRYAVSLWSLAQAALFLLAINVAMYWALAGQLAWQTHLGGCLSGMALAVWLDRSAPTDTRDP